MIERAQIIIEGWSWTREDRFQHMKFEGKVTNNTSRTLAFAKAFVEFYTAEGQFITSDYTYLDINNLLPGQSTTFTGYGNWNPSAEKATLNIVGSDNQPFFAIKREDIE